MPRRIRIRTSRSSGFWTARWNSAAAPSVAQVQQALLVPHVQNESAGGDAKADNNKGDKGHECDGDSDDDKPCKPPPGCPPSGANGNGNDEHGDHNDDRECKPDHGDHGENGNAKKDERRCCPDNHGD